MEDYHRRIEEALGRTEIVRPPRQSLAAFGETTVYYHLVTEPVYAEFSGGETETVLREGRVTYGQPRILTPAYLGRIEGFSPEAIEAIRMLGAHTPGILYRLHYRNEPEKTSIAPGSLRSVIDNLNRELDRKGDLLSAIIKGTDELWDICLIKFIHDMLLVSHHFSIAPEFEKQGLFELDQVGIPRSARFEIERLFLAVEKGKIDPALLKLELDRWGVFPQYEDRFFGLFRTR
jgi:hypothetical protein